MYGDAVKISDLRMLLIVCDIVQDILKEFQLIKLKLWPKNM